MRVATNCRIPSWITVGRQSHDHRADVHIPPLATNGTPQKLAWRYLAGQITKTHQLVRVVEKVHCIPAAAV